MSEQELCTKCGEMFYGTAMLGHYSACTGKLNIQPEDTQCFTCKRWFHGSALGHALSCQGGDPVVTAEFKGNVPFKIVQPPDKGVGLHTLEEVSGIKSYDTGSFPSPKAIHNEKVSELTNKVIAALRDKGSVWINTSKYSKEVIEIVVKKAKDAGWKVTVSDFDYYISEP